MKDKEESYPSLPANYITIVDLQKRWLEQQKQKKLFKEEIKKEKEVLNLSNKNSTNTEGLKPISQFQKPNPSKSYGNPNSTNIKFLRKNFKSKKTPEIGSGDNEIEERKVDVNKPKQKKKSRNKIIREDNDQTMAKEDQEKRQVIEDDRTVEIEPKLKEVFLGYRRVDHSHKNGQVEQEKETPKMKSRVEQQSLNQSTGDVREVNEVRKSEELKGGKFAAASCERGSRRSRAAAVGSRRRNGIYRNLVWVKRTELNL